MNSYASPTSAETAPAMGGCEGQELANIVQKEAGFHD